MSWRTILRVEDDSKIHPQNPQNYLAPLQVENFEGDCAGSFLDQSSSSSFLEPSIGCWIYYQISCDPEIGPVQVQMIDEAWNLVLVNKEGNLAWVNRCIITRMDDGKK